MDFLERTESFGLIKTCIENNETIERGYIYLEGLIPLHNHMDSKGKWYAEAYTLLTPNDDVRIVILDEEEALRFITKKDIHSFHQRLLRLLDSQPPMLSNISYICEPTQWHAIMRRSSSVPIIAYRKFNYI